MTLEEIIKKITEFLKGIYRSEKFAERFISFFTAYFLIELPLEYYDDYSVLDVFWGLNDEPEGIIIFILIALFYFINRTIYRFIIKRFGNKDE